METFEAIHNRRSVRNFSSVPVEWHKVTHILEAGKYAPSTGNLQAWRFIVVVDPKTREKIAETCLEQYWIETAPVIIVITALTYKTTQYYGLRGERLYSVQECAAAAENMILAAQDMGVGSCWISAFDEQEMKTTLGIPDNARPQIVLALGYPNEVTPRPPKERLETLVFLEQYGNRIRDASMVLGYYSEITKRNVDKAKEKLTDKFNNVKENVESGIQNMQKDIDTQVLPRLKSYEDKAKEQQTPTKPKGEQPKDE